MRTNTVARETKRIAVTTENFAVPALDPGITLFVASKRPAAGNAFPGGSWMEVMAGKGFCTYALDYRGYGRSTRPATMDEPPENNCPIPAPLTRCGI